VNIDVKLVKELREKAGAPLGECLKALQEAKGDMEEALVVLRKRGIWWFREKRRPEES
jgi:elongation factor Ts